jgi:sigma-B regulation protein RsbU (phosphoserine phosphatase)
MNKIESKYHQLEQENQRLKKAVGELSILNELSLAISGSLDSEKIVRTIISRSIRAIDAEQGDITLVVEDKANPTQTLVRSMDSSSTHSPLHLNQNLLGWMQLNKKPLLINDPHNDERFKNVSWDASVQTLLCAPLMAKSKLIGILTLYNKKGSEEFEESDKRLLSIIAAQSAQVVENARLYEEEQAYQEMRREMEMASAIQKKMLPSSPPEIEGYAVGGRNLTAQSVGGDYFDFIKLDDEHLVICLGDISGKGLSASLLMSNLQAILRGQVFHLKTPSEILRHANIQLFHNTGAEKFATLFLGILNIKTNELHFSSGGHEYPFLVNLDGTSKRLIANSLPLGMFEMSEYEDETIELQPGDCIFVYSDGITECINGAEEEFGEARLEEYLKSAGSDLYEPSKLIDRIFNACFKFSEKQQLFDDMTALVLARNP